MTAATSEALAQELDKLNLTLLANMARGDQFHDFKSPHAFPEMLLVDALHEAALSCPDILRVAKIMALRQRAINGDFDASKEESDEWAASEEGQAAFRALMEGK